MRLPYRPEIDGLRAVAVLAVIVYHLKLPVGDGAFLEGGYLGVDLFFVISGYLIGKIILSEIDRTGRFSLPDFYWRRARRILPPLILVILVSLPVAWQILLPSEMDRFSASLVAALGFFSNFFWYHILSDYGAQSGILQPFLHTWSLAIEEQFYLLFPLLLLLVYRFGSRRAVGPALFGLLLLSLGAAQVTTLLAPNASFFSPASRAWELLCGALLAWLSLRTPDALRARRAALAVPAAALAVILAAFWIMRLGAFDHPGLATLPVVLAACALIWFANPREPVTQLLSSGPMVAIGKLSYSLYLWHFPVFAFARLRHAGSPPGTEILLWLVLTFVLAVAGYVLIERPFRFPLGARSFTAAMGAAICAVLVFSSVTIANQGFRGRLGDLAALYGQNEFDNERLQDRAWSVLNGLAAARGLDASSARRASDFEAGELWFTDPGSRKLLMIGNSHSKDLFNALYLNRALFPGMEFARFAMGNSLSGPALDALMDAPNFRAADTILIAPKYFDVSFRNLPDLIRRFQELGKTVALVGNTAEFDYVGGLPVFDWYTRRNPGDPGHARLNSLAYRYESGSAKAFNAELARIARETGIPFLSRRDLLCDDMARSCTAVTPEGWKVMFDYGHWTLEGAHYVGQKIAETGWLNRLWAEGRPSGPGAAPAGHALESSPRRSPGRKVTETGQP